jgi:outer membrane protein
LGNAEVTTNGASFGAGLGINYFVTDRIVLNFGLRNILSYQTSKVDVAGAKNTSSFGFDLNGNIANPFRGISLVIDSNRNISTLNLQLGGFL